MSNKRSTAVWEHSHQKQTKLLIMLSLADRADDDGYCWPSLNDTAKRAKTLRSYATEMIRDLERDGELYIHAKPGHTHRYLVLPGMSEDEIFKALKWRFKLSDEQAKSRVSEIRTRREGVGNTDTQVSEIQTGGVGSTGHEPSINPKIKHQKTRVAKTQNITPDLEHLEAVFSKERGVPLPDWKADPKGTQKTWRTPLKTIRHASRTLEEAEEVILSAIRRMKGDHLTFTKPVQILEVAQSLLADRQTAPPPTRVTPSPSERQYKDVY